MRPGDRCHVATRRPKNRSRATDRKSGGGVLRNRRALRYQQLLPTREPPRVHALDAEVPIDRRTKDGRAMAAGATARQRTESSRGGHDRAHAAVRSGIDQPAGRAGDARMRTATQSADEGWGVGVRTRMRQRVSASDWECRADSRRAPLARRTGYASRTRRARARWERRRRSISPCAFRGVAADWA